MIGGVGQPGSQGDALGGQVAPVAPGLHQVRPGISERTCGGDLFVRHHSARRTDQPALVQQVIGARDRRRAARISDSAIGRQLQGAAFGQFGAPTLGALGPLQVDDPQTLRGVANNQV